MDRRPPPRRRGAPSRRDAWIAGLLLTLVGSCGGARSSGPSALLVTLDTTRADALGCLGGPEGVTPHLDRLAAEGVLFENAHSVAPVTMPSHASMLTGLYPLRHAVRGNDRWALSEKADTLAELARERGIQTSAVVAAVVLRRSFGLAQGFDAYSEPELPKTSGLISYEERKANEVVDEAIRWLDARDPQRPFFLWVHLFDPHETYDPPAAFRTRFPGPRGRYLGEVAFADREVGRLLDHLRAEGILDETTVMVVGDHGESLGDHGEATHGVLCKEATLHVPLILRLPGGARVGTRSTELVSVVDVFPTLSEALGIPVREGIDGLSLLGGVAHEGRGVYFESYEGYLAFGYSPLAGWMDARGKYVHGSTSQLFDLARDPGETENLWGERPAQVEEYEREIAALASLEALPPHKNTAADQATVESMRKLGYAAVGTRQAEFPHPLAPSERPLALDIMELHRELVAGMNAFHDGRLAEAETALRKSVQAMPWNPAAGLFLCQSLIGQRKFAEAVAPIRQFLTRRPNMGYMHYQLGNCLLQVGRPAEAVESLKRAVVLEAGSKEYYPLLIKTLLDLNRPAEARPFMQVYEELRRQPSRQ